MRISDWSSDVCSSDLVPQAAWGAYQLTTVCQHVEPMVDATVTLLRERMYAEAPARDIVVPCALVERKTVRQSGLAPGRSGRSEESRVGKECGSPCRSRWAPYH